jgi:hypothetical protein
MCKKAEPEFKINTIIYFFFFFFRMKIDEIHFTHITKHEEKEVLPLYMIILSSNE